MTFASGQVTSPKTSTTLSSGSAPAKPAISGPKQTACTVERCCLSVMKHNLAPCFLLFATRARIQTFVPLSAGTSFRTVVHSRFVLHSLRMNKLPNCSLSIVSNVTSGPLNLASCAAFCSASLRFFSSSFAFLASSFAFFFSSPLLVFPACCASANACSFSACGAAAASSAAGADVLGVVFIGALADGTDGGATVLRSACAVSGTGAVALPKPSWCTHVCSHRTVAG
mmetsp:Transcript_82611/g.230366  ORF Transcript_82611/g.230366 Transcript_82611/m.230366 type:complete len:227 (+) Transcript_82611:1325-2005(+)